MSGRPTDHKNRNLLELNRQVLRGTSNGQILFQPRIICWFDDKDYLGEPYPAPVTGLSRPDAYRALGVSNRIYDFNACFPGRHDETVRMSGRWLDELTFEHVAETPVGRVSTVVRKNTSNPGTFPVKWWVESEEDLKVWMYIEEHTSYSFDRALYDTLAAEWGDVGLPVIFLPRTTILNLYSNLMGVEGAVYALSDYPDTVEAFFKVLNESQRKLLDLVAASPIEWVNYGDNLHCGTLPPSLYKKYVLPTYLERGEILHRANKFTFSHWDGDTRALLPFAKESALDGIEAITPQPQGDVTLAEVKAALGDEVFLVDGIAAILFEEGFPEEMLVEQTREVIRLFAPKLILGISDEMASRGLLSRVELVRDIVDEFNATGRI